MRSVFLAALNIGLTTGLASNLLVNPSFELPVVPAGGLTFIGAGGVIGEGWVVDSTAEDAVVIDKGFVGADVTWPAPTDGNQFLYVAADASTSTILRLPRIDGQGIG
jgi:hypothetical protein